MSETNEVVKIGNRFIVKIPGIASYLIKAIRNLTVSKNRINFELELYLLTTSDVERNVMNWQIENRPVDFEFLDKTGAVVTTWKLGDVTAISFGLKDVKWENDSGVEMFVQCAGMLNNIE